ncbi:phosphate metabolism protein 8-like isoform X1 [Bidens hawaiensis]|uniref:phosphate metabolism protein 8-like isoform X1 n=1 Tax=Bidens hawaiensis TaxID=980011 RepID=UPI00404A9E9B
MEYENQSKYECLLFDVDDTLYPLGSGLQAQCTKNITEYMVNELHIDENKIPELFAQLYKNYGTTIAGLRAFGYDFDYDHYHRYRILSFLFFLSKYKLRNLMCIILMINSFVHGRLPYQYLKPDPVLRTLLHSLPIRKVIFSNANEGHVAEVLHRLGLEDCFDDVICFESLNPKNQIINPDVPKGSFIRYDSIGECGVVIPESPIVCKPFENALLQAFKIANINPHKTLFFDDSKRNIQTSKLVGLTTVLVGSSHRTTGVDYALESIHNMKEALPELWESISKSLNVSLSQKIVTETPVEA